MSINANSTSASISATTTSARTAYPAGNSTFVTVYNTGTVPIFVASGSSSVAATTTGQFVPAATMLTLEKKPDDTHLAAITASGTATVYFSNTGV